MELRGAAATSAAAGDTLQQQLAQLRAQFVAGLPERCGALRAQWARFSQGLCDREILENLHRMAHSLVGSGATFGLPRLSAQARALERLLKTPLEQTAAQEPSYWDMIPEALDLIEREVGSAQREDLPPEALALQAVAQTVPVSPQLSGQPVFLVAPLDAWSSELARQLRLLGYPVTQLAGLWELNVLRAQQPMSVVLLDIGLPGTPRDEVLAVARALADEGAALLLFANQADFLLRLQAVRAGARALVTLPLDLLALADWIHRCLHPVRREPPRILVVDDDAAVAAYTAGIVESAGMQARVTHDPLRAMDLIQEFSPDLIVTDIYMPQCTGLELAAVLRQQEQYASIPIVFLSSELDVGKQMSALDMGADDFLTKPANPHQLVATLEARVARTRVLRELMSHDGLTGLFNHKTTQTLLDKEHSRAQRLGSSLSVAMVDIDHFKLVNDRHGHQTGDHVLRALSRLLQQRLRQGDIVGRYGGEEFIVILPGANVTQARDVMEALRRSFSEISFPGAEGEFHSTFSCGICDMTEGLGPRPMVSAADSALYVAKRSGRNRVAWAGDVASPTEQ